MGDEFEDLVEIDLNEWLDDRMRAGDEDVSQPAEEETIGVTL